MCASNVLFPWEQTGFLAEHLVCKNVQLRLRVSFASTSQPSLYLVPYNILCSQRWRSSIQSAKTRLGADCGTDHELLIAKFRLKLKKAGKTTRPFRYDLNQIAYDYTVEETNRFKVLDLIECLKNYGQRFMSLYRRQESRPSPRKRNAKRQNSFLSRPYK